MNNQRNANNKTNINIYIIAYKLFSFSLLIIFISLIPSSKINPTNVSELQIYNNQSLKILLPSGQCKLNQKTLFFTSPLRDNSKELYKQYDIRDYQNKKSSFVTYYNGDEEYFKYETILSQHGLIKSVNIYADNNFFFSKYAVSLIKKNSTFMKLNNFKKFYRFYGYEVLMKDTLYMSYLEMKKEFGKDYNYMPETYHFPMDRYAIIDKFRDYKLNLDDLWLVKPTHMMGGIGIKILKSLKTIHRKEFLITKYITNLDLINGKKYDFRLYILVTGLKPLRIYFNQDGLVRIASKKFSLDRKSIKNRYVHLTNTGVNSGSKDFIKPNNYTNEEANIWNLHTYEKHITSLGADYKELKTKIFDIIIKSIISVYKNLTTELSENNLNDINFYDILGYDVIITNDYNPILLEINSGPSMYRHNALDKIIKTNLLIDTLNLVGITPFSKNLIFNQKAEPDTISVEYNVNNALCELSRPRGDYELIFPLKENIDKYRKYFKNRNTEENELFWEMIQKES